MRVVEKISEAAVDEKGRAVDRIEIRSATIRNRPVEGPLPFSTESAAEPALYRVTLETTAGAITLEMRPDKAPEPVRNFLRLAAAGVDDGVACHRVVHGFVITPAHSASGASRWTRSSSAASTRSSRNPTTSRT
jgi:hypothetical protein